MMNIIGISPRVCAPCILIFLSSCGNDDVVVTAICDTDARGHVAFEFRELGHEQGDTSFLNNLDLRPGDLLEFVPSVSSEQANTAKVVYTIHAPEESKLDSLEWRPVDITFRLEMDDDVKEAGVMHRMDWRNLVIQNTELLPVEAHRRYLKDVLQLVNRNGQVVDLMRRDGNQRRFAVVNGASYASGVQLAYVGGSIAGNTIEVSRYFVHVKYECAPVDSLNARARASATDLPILFSYVPIRFSESRQTVEQDPVPVPWNKLRYIVER